VSVPVNEIQRRDQLDLPANDIGLELARQSAISPPLFATAFLVY